MSNITEMFLSQLKDLKQEEVASIQKLCAFLVEQKIQPETLIKEKKDSIEK